MKNTRIILAFIGFSLFACEPPKEVAYWQKENATEFDEKLEIAATGKIVKFRLDDQTSMSSIFKLNYFHSQDSTYIYFLNIKNRVLNVYNLYKEEPVKQLAFEAEGPNGILRVTAPIMTSLDSTYFYDVPRRQLLGFKNDSCYMRLHWDDTFEEGQLNCNPGSTPNQFESMYKFGDKFYLTFYQYLSSILPNTQDDLVLNGAFYIDSKKEETKAYFPLPEFFKSGYWGHGLVLEFLFHTMNTTDGTMLYGYAADPYLYQYSSEGEFLSRRFVGSRYFKQIEPMSLKKEDNKAKSIEYVSRSSTYGSLYYDPYNNLYYRIAQPGQSMEDYRQGKKTSNTSLIILDENLDKLGEVLFDADKSSKHNIYIMFFHDKKIYILRKDLYVENDDFLYFEEFELKEI